MNTTIICITCVIVLILDALFAYRNYWVFKHLTKLNRFENGEHIVNRYLSYEEMMRCWWVWDIEKLKKENHE